MAATVPHARGDRISPVVELLRLGASTMLLQVAETPPRHDYGEPAEVRNLKETMWRAAIRWQNRGGKNLSSLAAPAVLREVKAILEPALEEPLPVLGNGQHAIEFFAASNLDSLITLFLKAQAAAASARRASSFSMRDYAMYHHAH